MSNAWAGITAASYQELFEERQSFIWYYYASAVRYLEWIGPAVSYMVFLGRLTFGYLVMQRDGQLLKKPGMNMRGCCRLPATCWKSDIR